MRMLLENSSYGIGTFAISVSCNIKMVGNIPTPCEEGLAFSIKCHNMIHLKSVDYRGPPQAASVSIEISDDIMRIAEPLSKGLHRLSDAGTYMDISRAILMVANSCPLKCICVGMYPGIAPFLAYVLTSMSKPATLSGGMFIGVDQPGLPFKKGP
ncbi:hypothetical protein LY78DRAFT_683920 [Colletotrichum sublineola]|nr:hypothetical protein LY78DRAFT_683920 [Colletotrichum sublineola]